VISPSLRTGDQEGTTFPETFTAFPDLMAALLKQSRCLPKGPSCCSWRSKAERTRGFLFASAPRETEMSRQQRSRCSAISGMVGAVIRDAGPEILTAAIALRFSSKIGAPIQRTPTSIF
jgi:hypothetical protein